MPLDPDIEAIADILIEVALRTVVDEDAPEEPDETEAAAALR